MEKIVAVRLTYSSDVSEVATLLNQGYTVKLMHTAAQCVSSGSTTTKGEVVTYFILEK